ncbi:MAG TPA: orotate phosphoribosyltransferase [Polyangiaceae bacterium]|jgi:orotate phosphoribosyltransferase|nr:orotate phosphoribosyltransferase [Polyangiaceae bacterium]
MNPVRVMETYKKDFIEFMVRSNVLTFGDFVAKSGRRTPYFVNTGKYRTGAQLARLAAAYADAIERNAGDGFDVLFGPAYKGIPLVVATSMELSRRGRDVGFAFNRKEAKDHGEGGTLVGWELAAGQRVLIVEDVTTAGTSIRETVPLLRAAADVTLAGLVVAVDRMERGTGDESALTEVGKTYGMKTFSIVNIGEIVEYLSTTDVDGRRVITDEIRERIVAYRREYGPC